MSGIAIFIEGGGDGNAGKAALRSGFDVFLQPLKDAVREKRLPWKLVMCGSRIDACNAFLHASQSGDYNHVFLLVDAEQPVKGLTIQHLVQRDGQHRLGGSCEKFVHLMIETMETWIAADAEALKAYYKQGFAAGLLPRAANLEGVGKVRMAQLLNLATRKTSKGPYQKILHASELLKKLNPATVQSRCPSCARFFAELAGAIATA